MAAPLHAALEQVARRAEAGGRTGEVLFSVTQGILDDEETAFYGDPDRPFFLASATKLYVTALLVQLRRQGRVDWDEPFAGYLPDIDTAGMHVLRGVDATASITVRHLLSHTSGLPDYFEDPRLDGSTTYARMLERDFAWDLHDVVRWTRDDQVPGFPPGAPGRAHYSDTNFQLLGGIIERQFGVPFGQAVAEQILRPLGLHSTFCFDAATMARYGTVAPLRNGRGRIDAPSAMSSFGADGGMVSTLRDGQRFVRAFFDGTLVPFDILLGELCRDWRTVMFPLRYGTGVMRFRLPLQPPLDGHSGLCGVVMYVDQARGLSVVGTVNQVRQRTLPYRMMQRIAAAAR